MKMKRFIIPSLLFITIGLLGMGKAMEKDSISCNLDVEVLQDSCRFSLIVSNNTDTEIILQFPTGQQYDFVVKSSDGQIVWQWSRGMAFIQMFTSLILNPHEEKRFTDEYSFPTGEYIAQGILTSTPKKFFTDFVEFTVSQPQMPVLKGKITMILGKLYLLGEDGTVYLIINPSRELTRLQNKTIEVTSYQTEPIPGTVDKKIIIKVHRVL